MTYSEKLKDPRWQKKRLEILDRDQWMCRVCGDVKTTLVVHHNKYIRGKAPWNYPDINLITLCEKCHNKFHNKQKSKPKIKIDFTPTGFPKHERKPIKNISIREGLNALKNMKND